MMKNKNRKGQFYLVAILVIISIFIAFTVVNNTVFTPDISSTSDLLNEIEIEKRKVLDYVTFNNLTNLETQNIFTNFSNSYLEKIGKDKNSFFIIGDSTNVNIIGYKTDNSLIFYYNSTDFVVITDNYLDVNVPVVGNKVQMKIDDNVYDFDIYPGQNLYYLINYNYNKEVYIIYG